jgi:lipopolysaccharide biosynthesis glycosyltransferase
VIDEQITIEPIGPEGSVRAVFSADANYAPYLAVALASLAGAAGPGNFYDVIVLSSGLDAAEQKKIGAALPPNISLRFFDVRKIIEARAADFFINAHLSLATYFRLFTPSLFKNFEKILYLDCDIIVLEDAANLYNTDLKNFAAGVARDFFANRDLACARSRPWARQLGIADTDNYFNAGVMLLNLAKLRTDKYKDKWFQRLRAVKTPRLHDQDILNHTLENDIMQLNAAWNSLAWMESLGEKIWPGEIPAPLYAEYLATVAAPKILHFSSRHKPWDLPHLPRSEHFWQNAAKTPYYHDLIFKNLQHLNAENDLIKGRLRLPPLTLKYLFYKLMATIPGEIGAKFRAKVFRIKKMNPGLKKFLRSWH